MKIAVLAANGRTGQEFVVKALKAGHQIRAGVYGGTLSPSENLEIINCDAINQQQIETLIAGCDAVVSFIGHVKGSPKTVQAEAIKALIEAMKKHSIQRIISLTGTGVRFPGDTPNLIDRLLNLSVTLIDPDRIKDGIMHAKLLTNSDLDWTIIRVLKLQNTAAKPFVLRPGGPAKLIASRSEVAEAFLFALTDSSTIKQAPVICNP